MSNAKEWVVIFNKLYNNNLADVENDLTLNELILRELRSNITTYDDNGIREAIDIDDTYEIADNIEKIFKSIIEGHR